MNATPTTEGDEAEAALPRRYRFSLLWVFEVVTIIGVSLALHRDPKLPWSPVIVLVWSAASGAYLGYRWHPGDDFSSCGRWTVGLSALITFLNALALGIILGERASRAGGYFSVSSYFPLVLMLAFLTTTAGMSLGGIFGAAAAYWREQVKSKRERAN